MENEKLNRINELARKAKHTELTQQEIIEQKQLRMEYIEGYRKSLRAQLDNIVLVEPDGTHTKIKPKIK